eukprot:jgi/Mesvir1/2290/Mv19328-RA.1
MDEQGAAAQLAAILKSPLPVVGRRLVSALDNWREVAQVIALCKGLRRSPLVHSKFIACGGIRSLVRSILATSSEFTCPAEMPPSDRLRALDAAQAATVSLLVSLLQVPSNRDHVEHNQALAQRLLTMSADDGLSLTSRFYAIAALAGVTALEHGSMLELPPLDAEEATPGAAQLRAAQWERLVSDFANTKTWTQFVVEHGLIPQIVSSLLRSLDFGRNEAPPPAGTGAGLRLRFEGLDLESCLLKALFSVLNVHEAVAGGGGGPVAMGGYASSHSSGSELSNGGSGAGGSSNGRNLAASKCAELRSRVSQVAACGGVRVLLRVLHKRVRLLEVLRAETATLASEMDVHDLFLHEVGDLHPHVRPQGSAARTLRRMERELAESTGLLLRCVHVIACILRADPCRLPGPEEAEELSRPALRDVLGELMVEEDPRLATGARRLAALLGFPDAVASSLVAQATQRAQQRLVNSWVEGGMADRWQ